MLRKTLLAPALASLLSVVACGGEPSSASGASAASTGAVLELAKDWSVTLSGTISPAHALTFRYDLARLSKCRLVEYGQPAWAVVAYVSFDGGAPREIVLGGSNGTTSGVVENTIPIPIASDVAFWFYASDDGGCTEWDSKYGQNFHFAIAKAQGPTLHFASDFSVAQSGSVGPGTVLVDYDPARAPCHATNNGNDAYGITMWWSIDGAPAQSQEMLEVVGARRFPTPRFISLPQGNHDLALWFENTDVYGCHAWDSSYGRNFSFAY